MPYKVFLSWVFVVELTDYNNYFLWYNIPSSCVSNNIFRAKNARLTKLSSIHGLHRVRLNPHQPDVATPRASPQMCVGRRLFPAIATLLSLSRAKVVASAEEIVFVLTLLPIMVMVGLGLFKMDWALATTPPALSSVDWKSFIQIMFWTSTYWQKVRVSGGTLGPCA